MIVGISKKLTVQKIKFSIKDFFSKSDQIRSFPRISSHLLKKSLMENFIFCAVLTIYLEVFPEPMQTSKMERFAAIVNGFYTWSIVTKLSTVDICWSLGNLFDIQITNFHSTP